MPTLTNRSLQEAAEGAARLYDVHFFGRGAHWCIGCFNATGGNCLAWYPLAHCRRDCEPVVVSGQFLTGWTIEEPESKCQTCRRGFSLIPCDRKDSKFYCVKCGREVPSEEAYSANSDGTVCVAAKPEPKVETYEVEIHWPEPAADHYGFVSGYGAIFDVQCRTSFVGYIFPGLEDLPDDQLPQQARVWVLAKGSSSVMYPPSCTWLSHPWSGFELRQAVRVRLRK